jgi:hypothetical protein
MTSQQGAACSGDTHSRFPAQLPGVWEAIYPGLAAEEPTLDGGRNRRRSWRPRQVSRRSSPHFPARRSRFRARSTHSIKTRPAKGLARKPMAPPLIARARTLSSGKAVMKMNGTSLSRLRTCVKRSKPPITGICTSAMTQDVSSRWAACRKSWADAKVRTLYPCELRRLSVAARTDASSSMTEITERVDKTGLPEVRTKCLT